MCLVLVVVRNWIGSWLQNHPVPASPFYIIDQLTEVGRAFDTISLEGNKKKRLSRSISVSAGKQIVSGYLEMRLLSWKGDLTV